MELFKETLIQEILYLNSNYSFFNCEMAVDN